MQRGAHAWGRVTAIVAVVIMLSAACGDSDPAGPQAPPGAAPFVSEPASPSAAVEAGAACLEDRYGTIDVASLSLIAYLGANWDEPVLAAAAGAAQQRLATAELDELGCEIEDAGSRRERLVAAIAAELAAADEVTDLAVEQSAVLHDLDAGDRVPDDWADRVLSTQRTDGGWGERVSTWHMTLLAVWTILAENEAGEGVAMVGRAA